MRHVLTLSSLLAAFALSSGAAGLDTHAPAAPKPKVVITPSKPAAIKAPAKDEPAATGGHDADRSDRTDAPADAAATKPVNFVSGSPAAAHAEAAETVSADQALQMLKDGNARWVAGTPQNPETDSARRVSTAENGQHPFVSLLTCADSRIPAERVFDRGVGELFVIRVAGNIAGESETGTLEYGVGHLKTPLLVVMGHTKCGAVAAAATNAEVHGHVAGLVEHIKPAVERAKRTMPQAEGPDLAAAAVRENVWQQIFDLYQASPELREAARSGALKVIGAIYDVGTGKVEFLGEHPWQQQLLAATQGRGSSNTKEGKAETASADDEHGH